MLGPFYTSNFCHIECNSSNGYLDKLSHYLYCFNYIRRDGNSTYKTAFNFQ